MGNYNFYTPIEVAEIIVSLLPHTDYKKVIDICCGSWNLLEAARRKFSSAQFIGVDIEESAAENCFEKADFYVKDGRDFAIEAYKKGEKYDLILSNPPFGYLSKENKKQFPKENCYIAYLNNKRYENEMMQANLMLAEEDGILVFILPSTFVEGEINKKLRSAIAQKYWIRDLVRMPLETFGDKGIYTWAVIIQNLKQKIVYSTNYHEIVLNNDKYTIMKIDVCSHERMVSGVWTGNKEKKEIKQEVSSFRGHISSSQLSEVGEKVYHCSSTVIGNHWYPSQRYSDKTDVLAKCKKAQPGDIIVNRIGRCAGYWYLNREEGYVSDCLIVFHAKDASKLKKCFQQNSSKGKLNIPIKGVATRYVTASDIVALL